MTVYYIDGVNGFDSNGGLTSSTPRKTIPTTGIGADGDVYLFKRGSTYSVINTGLSVFYWPRQGIVLGAYGDPNKPRPIITYCGSNNYALNFQGDTIIKDLHFKDVLGSLTETTDSYAACNCLNFGVRGGASQGTAEGVSAIILNCKFENISNNAISFSAINSDAQYQYATPTAIIHNCEFDGIGGDAVFGSIRDYCEISNCTIKDVGNRLDLNVTDYNAEIGGRRSAGDCVGLLYCTPNFIWIHDNILDHTKWDCKHCIMLDNAAGDSFGLALIERNVLLCYGSDTGAVSVNSAGINTQMRTIIRQNLIMGSKELMNIDTPAVAEVYSNIFVAKGSYPGDPALITWYGATGGFFSKNIIWADVPNGTLNASAFFKSSGVTELGISHNIVGNFSTAFKMINSQFPICSYNAFYNTAIRYLEGSNSTIKDLSTTDISCTPDDFMDVQVYDFSPKNIKKFTTPDNARNSVLVDFKGKFNNFNQFII